jgi:hypothetical protein
MPIVPVSSGKQPGAAVRSAMAASKYLLLATVRVMRLVLTHKASSVFRRSLVSEKTSAKADYFTKLKTTC